MPFYKKHPLVGQEYGDFHIRKQWTIAEPKLLHFSQTGRASGNSAFFSIELQEFVPPPEDDAVDLKGRSMYAVPWATPDPQAVSHAIDIYINETTNFYIDDSLDGQDSLEWMIFKFASRASILPTPVSGPAQTS